jgi:PKD repeat protein
MAAVVPTSQGSPVTGPSFEGSGQLGGFSPGDLRSAYGLPSTGGDGQLVAITIAYDDPNAESDLATYRSHYGLPACAAAGACFAKVNQDGESGNYPEPNPKWALETSLDLDMVSATCPQCRIVLVEADSNEFDDMASAVETAANLGATVISNSWATEEFAGEAAENPRFDHPGIPTLFATGDWGYGVYYPAASPSAIAVGGTSLSRSGNSRGWSESAWSGAGSGCSSYEAKPAWQKDAGCPGRSLADVSAVADPQTPVSVYDSYQQSGWELLGGTSVATPLVAGVEALSTVSFRASGPSGFWRAGSDVGLFDVSAGENGSCASESQSGFDAAYLCQAAPGYDGPSGWGSPEGPLSLPIAVTERVTVVDSAKAVLHGSVEPGGLPTTYRFEYGETTDYGTSVPIAGESVGSGSEYVEASQAIEGLQAHTPYHYRIVATNSAGTFPGVDRSFGTTPPQVTTGAAEEVHASGATLHASINPEGLETTYYFEYGPTDSYGYKAPIRAALIDPGEEDVEVSAAVSGLGPSQAYHFRAVAKSSAGLVRGDDEEFLTAPSHWTPRTLPQPPNSGKGHRAFDVSCVEANRCIAVGENWSLAVHTEVTLAEAWDGTEWTAMETPNPPELDEGWQHNWYALLSSVSCSSASDCLAVGYYRDPSESVKPLVEHWDGSEWEILPAPIPSGTVAGLLNGVSCTSATACTAVGYSEGGGGTKRPLVGRWDGSSWTIQPAPSPGATSGSRLLAVSCPTMSSCTAVGFNHEVEEETTLAERWNGIEWQVLSTVELGGTQPTNRLEAVSCNSPSACMAVGGHLSKFGSAYHWGPLTERWNGSAWSLQAIPEPSASEEASLSGVSCASVNSCTAVGNYRQIAGSGNYTEVLGERWNGTSWSILEMPGPSQPPGWWHESQLFAASCPQAEACTAVGAGLSAPSGELSPYRALAEQEVAALLASFSSTPGAPIATQPIQFAGSASSPGGHTIESYEWDFGDGSHGSGASTSHAYAHAGDYTVDLTVTDEEGDSAETSQPISVAPAPPHADFQASAAGQAGTRTFTFDGSSSSDPDGTIEQWSWDFGDGSHGKGINPLHTYAQAGEYTATLTVTDDAGLEDSVSKAVVVTPPPDPKGGENPNPGTLPTAPAPPAPASFDLRGIAIDCTGQIVLSLLASEPGRFEATATAAVPGHRAPGRQRAGGPRSGCPSDSPTSARRSSILARPATRFAYGAASAPTQGAKTTRLTIAPSARAEREAARGGSLRIAISISLSTPAGGKPHKRTSLLYRR